MLIRISAGAVALALSAAVPAQSNLLDPSFGFGGRTAVAFDLDTSKRDSGKRVIRVANGKLLAIGEVDIADPNPEVKGIGLARLNPDGSPDNPFGGANDGTRVKNAGLVAIYDAYRLPDDFILVAGQYGNDGALVRLRSDGLDDTDFAGDGGIAWDASGIGGIDRARAVLSMESRYFVAGDFDSDPANSVNFDAWVGRVDTSSGALIVFVREELGGSDGFYDSAVDIVPAYEHDDENDRFAVLADNDSPDYAGTVMVIDAVSTARVGTVRLDDVLTQTAGCNPQYDNPDSAALVRIDNRHGAVLGTLREGGIARQAYVIVYDAIDGTFESATCGPRMDFLSVHEGIADFARAPEPRLHLAVTDGALGYWRWARISDTPLTFAPDLGFNGGLPVTADFASATSPTGAISFAQGIELDDRRPVVIGSRTWRIDNGAGVFDTDYALMRVHASETVLRDGFEED